MTEFNITGDVSELVRRPIPYLIEGFIIDKRLCYRTQGLKNLCGLELELNMHTHPAEASRIIKHIIKEIKYVDRLYDGLVTSELTGAPVLIKEVIPKTILLDNEKVYRIILSDEDFILPTQEECDERYKFQLI